MVDAAAALGTMEGYGKFGGYGAEQGQGALREKLASVFYPNDMVKSDEIFVSDGSKCDISRLQMLFGRAVQVDPGSSLLTPRLLSSVETTKM